MFSTDPPGKNAKVTVPAGKVTSWSNSITEAPCTLDEVTVTCVPSGITAP